jgi:hypothetical protein
MVSETIRHLIERGAGAVLLNNAERRARQRRLHRPRLGSSRTANKLPPPDLIHLTSPRADDPFQFQ